METVAAGVGRTVDWPHLDPLVWADAAQGDGCLRSVQQNFELGAFGVLAGTNTNGDHPVGAIFTCSNREEREPMRNHRSIISNKQKVLFV